MYAHQHLPPTSAGRTHGGARDDEPEHLDARVRERRAGRERRGCGGRVGPVRLQDGEEDVERRLREQLRAHGGQQRLLHRGRDRAVLRVLRRPSSARARPWTRRTHAHRRAPARARERRELGLDGEPPALAVRGRLGLPRAVPTRVRVSLPQQRHTGAETYTAHTTFVRAVSTYADPFACVIRPGLRTALA
jgi:hypothetical protein